MNAFLKGLAEKAGDASALAKEISISGLRSVNGVFNDIKLFGSLRTLESDAAERDETHYILVPVFDKGLGYSIFTKRVLPPGIGPTNSLPKARIFHIPDEKGKALLEGELIKTFIDEKKDEQPDSSSLGDTLVKIADQIDHETTKISGGILIIGGIVATINPVVGVGIAAKAIFPSLTAKLSKTGSEFLSSKLNALNESSQKTKQEKQAKKFVEALEPELFVNPLIRSLEAIISDPGSPYDPFLDPRNSIDAFSEIRHYQITTEAIQEVYSGSTEKQGHPDIPQRHVDWISHLIEQAQT